MATDTTSPMPSSTTGEADAAPVRVRDHVWLDTHCRMRPDGLYFDEHGNFYRPATEDEAQRGLNDAWPGDPVLMPASSRPAESRSPLFDELVKALEAWAHHFGPLEDNEMLDADVRSIFATTRELLDRIRSGEQP